MGTSSRAMAPILERISQHAASGIETAVVESSAKRQAVKYSYADLLENVMRLSKVADGMLSKRREGLPRHVAFCLHPSIAYVIAELTVWGAGACCVPISVHSPAPEVEYCLEDSDSALLITDELSEDKMRQVAEKFGHPLAVMKPPSDDSKQYTLVVEGEVPEPEGLPVTAETNALILYTSGTTGKPKGVVHTFASLTAQNESLSEAWKWSSKDYTLHVLPLHHIHGVQNILNTALYNGAGVEVTAFDAAFCLKRLCSGDITCFHAVPTIYVKFTQHLNSVSDENKQAICKGLRNESLRYMVSGSAALPVPTMKSWAEISGHVLLERYGMTEIGMGLSNNIDGTRYPGCVGWALPQVEVKCDDDGAILIKGPLVCKEYWKREEATKKEFTEDGWFKTGDNCQVGGTAEELQALQDSAREVEAATGRPSGTIAEKAEPELAFIWKILGRTSIDIIKSGGYKISALEIESVLAEHPKIKEIAVFGKPDEEWGEKVTAVAVLKEPLTIKELRDWGKERLAVYKVPQTLEVCDELPRNQMGKLEKKKIIDQYCGVTAK